MFLLYYLVKIDLNYSNIIFMKIIYCIEYILFVYWDYYVYLFFLNCKRMFTYLERLSISNVKFII